MRISNVLRIILIPAAIYALAKPKQESKINFDSEKAGGCQACGGLPVTKTSDTGCTLGVNFANCYQPPLQVKCCDQACPKCLGGIPPRPGGLCRFGCPEGVSCPDTCPCDECVCCYTITKLTTETSTCLDSTTVQVVQQDTSTEQKYETTVTTRTEPITFTVTDIFMFTAFATSTRFASSASFITTFTSTQVTLPSLVYLTTIVSTRFFSVVRLPGTGTITVTTNPVIVRTTRFRSTQTFRTQTRSITTVTGFSFDVISVEQTSTVPGTGTFFQFTSVADTLSLVTGVTPGPLLTTVIFSNLQSATETVVLTVGTTSFLVTDTIQASFTPTVTRATTTVDQAIAKTPAFDVPKAMVDPQSSKSAASTTPSSLSKEVPRYTEFALPFFPQ